MWRHHKRNNENTALKFCHLYNVGWYLGEIFHLEGGVAQEQATQRICGYPSSGNIQSQAGCIPGQPDTVDDNPVHSRGMELDNL